MVDKQWFTPNEFERLAGKERFKNWKMSIRCAGTTLGKLIQVCWRVSFYLGINLERDCVTLIPPLNVTSRLPNFPWVSVTSLLLVESSPLTGGWL